MSIDILVMVNSDVSLKSITQYILIYLTENWPSSYVRNNSYSHHVKTHNILFDSGFFITIENQTVEKNRLLLLVIVLLHFFFFSPSDYKNVN